MILLVGVAAVGCLGLAWWQWTRYESTSGSFQNLGYALQWPMFACFCVSGYYKFVRYEVAPPPKPNHDQPTEIPQGLLPERPSATTRFDIDPAMREYNAYLAQLAGTERAADTDDRTTP